MRFDVDVWLDGESSAPEGIAHPTEAKNVEVEDESGQRIEQTAPAMALQIEGGQSEQQITLRVRGTQ